MRNDVRFYCSNEELQGLQLGDEIEVVVKGRVANLTMGNPAPSKARLPSGVAYADEPLASLGVEVGDQLIKRKAKKSRSEKMGVFAD